MKKFYVLIAMLCIAAVTFGQNFEVGSVSSKKININHSSLKTPTDTTGWSSANFYPQFAVGGSVYSYTNQGGGYVYGVNNIGGSSINKLSQGYGYLSTGTIGIEGVCFWLAGLYSVSSDATSKLTFSIYNKPDSVPTTQVGTITADYMFSDCDSTFGAFNTVYFSSPIPVTADFAVVCNFANIKTDTVGFVSDADGEGVGWTALRYGTTWYTYVKAYHLNSNVSIWAIVDVNYVGIDSHDFFQGSQMTINQNPAKDNLSISYAVENNAKVEFELLSMTGQSVYKSDEGAKQKGSVYTLNADISNLPAGVYLCSLNNNGKRLIKKVVIE